MTAGSASGSTCLTGTLTVERNRQIISPRPPPRRAQDHSRAAGAARHVVAQPPGHLAEQDR